MGRTRLLILLSALCAGSPPQVLPVHAFSGNWSVSPVTIELGHKARSAVVTVSNKGKGVGEFEVRVMDWTQDKKGEDVYGPSKDIIYFPRYMKIAADESRVIRLAARVPPSRREKTYRLFVTELPDRTIPKTTGISLQFQFAIPIFVPPPETMAKGRILDSGMAGGTVHAIVVNEGNARLRIDSVAFQGKKPTGEILFEKTIQGYILLAGTSRVYAASIPADRCAALKTVDLTVKARGLTLKETITVDGKACVRNE